MAPRFPLGTSDFAKLRRDGKYYVDKTGLAVELIRSSSEIVLFPRPRRFGKTLNLSMLRYWFERPNDLEPEDVRALFAGMSVTSAGDDVAAHFQRHPVIYLTFKDVKHRTWAACRSGVVKGLAAEIQRLEPTWARAPLTAEERRILSVVSGLSAANDDIESALRVLCRALHLATGEEAVLLIDEYDTPIHAGWAHGYYDEVVELFRNLLSGGLKDNKHLYRGVLTGILRVAKESIFSGLNNVNVYSLLSSPFARWFGFTEEEVTDACALTGPEADLGGIRRWYNGYRMGPHLVYNPWSVLSYLDSIADGFRPYWVNTASDDLLRDLLIRQGPGLHDELAELMEGGELLRPISEDIQLRDLRSTAADVWSFLLFSGYLKAVDVRQAGGRTLAALSIPNREVLTTYQGLFLRWLDSSLGSGGADALCRALLAGEEAAFEALLQRLVVESLSTFDTGGKTPEAVYQAFLVGLLVQVGSTHIVDSNRESGHGRYDVCVRPRPGHAGSAAGAVLELKSINEQRGETAKSALAGAMKQIKEREYATALRQAGADPVWLWAAVFDGKRVWVQVEAG